MTHIDDPAIAAATRFYHAMLPWDGHVLDLMSSWVSHLPETLPYASVTGLGMNPEELERNPVLTHWVQHDLNAEPTLPFPDESFDGAVCSVSVQYLTSPVEIFREMARVLKPGAPFAVTFSNRCFPTKAIAAWRALDDRGHAELVGLYFRLAGGFDQPEAYDLSPNPGRTDPLFGVVARKAARDRTPEGDEPEG